MLLTVNSVSSLREWKGQPPQRSMISRLKRNPVPETTALSPRRVRGALRKAASRRNHRPYPAEIQLSPKFLEFR